MKQKIDLEAVKKTPINELGELFFILAEKTITAGFHGKKSRGSGDFFLGKKFVLLSPVF